MKTIVRACTVSNSISFVVPMLPQLTERYKVAILASPGEYWRYLDGYDVQPIQVPMARRISLIRDTLALFNLVRAFRKMRPDMVHSMTPKAGLLCMMAAKIARVPVRVHTFTGLVFPTAKGLKRKVLKFTDKLTAACATHIIPEGKGVRNDLFDNHITGKPLEILGDGSCVGVDPEYFMPGEKVTSAEFTFVCVGRLVRDKGINELVKAFCAINTEFPETRLLLVGDMDDGADPLHPATLKRLHNHPSIKAVGHVDDVRPYYALADCAVLPSYREGFPNAVLEAGAMGLPQIVTDVNGANEIVTDGVNGLVIPPRSAEDLADAMRIMITDTTGRERMARAARPTVIERFTQARVRDALMQFYDAIL